MSRILWIALALAGCVRAAPQDGIPVDVGSSDPEPVLRFYLGSYMPVDRVDTVLVYGGSGWSIRMDVLEAEAPELHAVLMPSTADDLVERDELRMAVQKTYAAARHLPSTVQELVRSAGFEGDWLEFGVRGSMTPYERRIRIPMRAVESALRASMAGGGLKYAPGTVVVGEHLDDGTVVETTAMIRREDGFWDFAAYDADGERVDEIRGESGPLAAPTRCFGCHYGNRAFEPEASFPAVAADGPHGARFIEAPGAWVDADVARRLDEHRRRSDGLLGLYATLLVGRWKSGDEPLTRDREQLLETLGL